MKKILFIVSAFPPESEIGCIRVGNIARELKRRDYVIDVISVTPGTNSNILNNFDQFDICNSLIHVSNGVLFSKLFLNKRDKMLKTRSAVSLMSVNDASLISIFKAKLSQYFQFGYSLLRNIDLYFRFRKILKNKYASKHYDFVFTSYPSLCSIWGGEYASQLFNSTLITDFRDPIYYQHNTFWLKSILNKYFEKRAIVKADLVTSVSKGIMRNHINTFGDKIHVLYNGFSSNTGIFIKKKKSKKFKISYLGSLYGGKRDLASFFDIIRELMLMFDSQELQSKFEFCYAGKESDLFNSLAKKYGIEKIVKDLGLLDKEEALNLQSSSDMALVITWNTDQDQGILTGKLFESFGMKVPIFGIVQGSVPNSEFAKIINYVNGGLLLEEIDYEDKEKQVLLNRLKKMIDKERWGNEVPLFYNNKLDEFKITNVVEKLMHKMEELKK